MSVFLAHPYEGFLEKHSLPLRNNIGESGFQRMLSIHIYLELLDSEIRNMERR